MPSPTTSSAATETLGAGDPSAASALEALGDSGAATVAPKGPSWRKRHPVLARVVLYGGALALLGAGLLVGRQLLESSRQSGLVTRIQGAEMIRPGDPAGALKILREDVLAKSPNGDVERKARLAEAATLDFMGKYVEAEKVYAALDASWPDGIPRGAIRVPWANMRVSAGKPAEALALIATRESVEGWPVDGPDGVEAVRSRARTAPAAGDSAAPAGGASGLKRDPPKGR